MSKTLEIDLAEALEFAVDVAKQAGVIARQHYSPDIAFDPKGDDTPVTKADLEINRLVVEECMSRYPEVAVIGEEESAKGSSNWAWVCDPIDGTTPYMLGAHVSTFCLALVHDGVPVVGVVNDFMNKRLYSAVKGQGAFLNGKPIGQAHAQPLKLIELENWPKAQPVGDLRERLFEDGWQVTNFVSFSFTVMAVATDRIGGTIYTGTYAWDVAAAKVIAEERGCLVTSLDGWDQRYDGPITGAVVIHPSHTEEIQRLVSEARK